MKTPSRSLCLALVLALAGSAHAAQARVRSPRPAPPIPATVDPSAEAPEPPEPAELPEPPEPPELPDIAAGAGVGEEMGAAIQMQVERARRDAERHMQSLNSGLARMQHNFNGSFISAGGPQSFRALVLPGADGVQDMAGIKEELVIMGRVLEKGLNLESERRGNPFRFEFGSVQWGGRNDLDALYLDGYGAIFLLEVDYPLVAGAAVQPEKPAAAAPKDDAWSKARREVRGEPDPDEPSESPEGVFPRPDPKPFDAARVEALRGRLLAALQQAHHLQCVRDGETVTLVVSGSSSGNPLVRRVRNRSNAGGPPGPDIRVREARVEGPGARPGTVMTLRVKKTDLEALRSGRITAEEWAKKVTVLTRSDAGARPRP